MNQKIKTSIIVFILIATIITIGYIFREKLKQELLPIGTIPSQVEKTSEQLAEEQRKVDERVEKLKEGYFEALHAKVIEIDQSAGILKVEVLQLEEPKIMEISFAKSAEVTKVTLKENAPEQGEGEDLASLEEIIEKGNLSLIKTDSIIQIETGDLFKIDETQKLNATKITVFEQPEN
jgi:hypothetical protein